MISVVNAAYAHLTFMTSPFRFASSSLLQNLSITFCINGAYVFMHRLEKNGVIALRRNLWCS